MRYLKAVMLLSACFSLLATGAFFVQLTFSTQRVEARLDSTLDQTQAAVDEVNLSTKLLRQHANRVLTEAGLTAMEARKASHDQRIFLEQELPQLTAKANLLLDHGNDLASGLVVTNRDLDQGIKDISRSTAEAVAKGGRTVDDLDKLVTDQQLHQLLTHLNGMSASGDQALADGAAVVHKATHPPAQGRVKRYFIGGLQVGKLILETAYYLTRLP